MDGRTSIMRLFRAFAAELAARLKSRYAVRIEERVYIEPESDPVRQQFRLPDVYLVRKRSGKHHSGGGTAVAAQPIEVITIGDLELKEAQLVVKDAKTGKVVTVIEVLSPSNKTIGAAGRDSFMTKRRDVLHSPTHWVEIDLLRSGTPPDGHRWGQECDYIIHISPDRRPKGQLWPAVLRKELPTVQIPLAAAGEQTPLDLQAVLRAAYDRAHYETVVDYSDAPNPPLKSADAAWPRRSFAAPACAVGAVGPDRIAGTTRTPGAAIISPPRRYHCAPLRP